MQKSALEVLYCTTKNHECVNDIGATLVLGHLLLLLFSLPDVDSQMLTLDALYDLMSVTVIVKECLAKGPCSQIFFNSSFKVSPRNALKFLFFRWLVVCTAFILQLSSC